MSSLRDPILSLRSQGKSYREIEKALGCSKAIISYHCSRTTEHKETVERNREARYEALHVPRCEDANDPLDQMLQWLLKDGVRRTDIADALGLTVAQVSFYARRQGYKLDRGLSSSYERVKRRRRHLKMLAVAMLGAKCVTCGYDRCIHAFDFHHKDPSSKDFNISRVTSLAWSRVKAEVQKCELLCSNCHREHHAGLMP